MRPTYFWPLALIALGVLLLLDNLNLLPGSAWEIFWPLVLIVLGINLLLRRGNGSLEMVDDSAPLEDAASAHVTFKYGAGRLDVRSGADAGLVFAGTFGGGVDKRVERSGDRLDITLSARSPDWTDWAGPWNWWRAPRHREWSVRLNPGLPLALTFETGASDSHLDLSALRVGEVTIKTGASATHLTLPARATMTRARIESGAASVDVSIPDGVAARIRGVMGLGALDVNQARFPRRGGLYESDGFETAANRVELDIAGGVGSVNVR